MTYVSKREKIFGLPNCAYLDCTPPSIKRSDGRLKQFPSIIDDRVWSLNEKERYNYLYCLVTGSRTCLEKSWCHRYVPLEDLLNLLLAEKNDYIKRLEKQAGIGQVRKNSKKDKTLDELFRRKSFEDEEEEEVSSLKLGPPKVESHECKTANETLRKVMWKLENIDEIVNEIENKSTKLAHSKEMIKFLQHKKCKLHKELENLRSKCRSADVRDDQEVTEKEQLGESELMAERDNLKKKEAELQNELIVAREKLKQMELMKTRSQFESAMLEQMIMENACYKKKLATTKCLEHEIQELKKQANSFADKYKKDVECLQEDKNKLKRRVNELTKYETQYTELKSKLQQVNSIIAENEKLTNKLACLEKLELENELLRCDLEQCQLYEMEVAENKEKIIELQCAVADQEEEMKDLLCQIEMLTRAYDEGSELDKLKEELSEKVCKLKVCEERLTEIPFLEAEIDELRSKLEKQSEQPSKASTIKKEVVISDEIAVDEPTELGTRYEENVDLKKQPITLEDIKTEEAIMIETADKCGEKKSMTCEEVQNLLQASKGIISCILEDMIEHQNEMEESEKRNRKMKEEIEILKAEMGKSDMDACLKEIVKLKLTIQEKERKVCCLEQKLKSCVDPEKVNDQMRKLECEIKCLRETNNRMRNDLEVACGKIQRCAELESMLEEERHARTASETKDADLSKMQKEEFNLEAKESFSNDIDALKSQMDQMNKIIEDLKRENSLLKETIQTYPDFTKELDEKHALETLLNLLQNELETYRQNTSDDCENLRKELKRQKDQNCQLKTLINRQNQDRLELKSSSKERSFKKATDSSIRNLNDRRSKSPNSKSSEEGSSKDIKERGCKSQKSVSSRSRTLENENNKLKTEVTRLRCDIATLCTAICDQSKQIERLKACIKNLMKKRKSDDTLRKETAENLQQEVSEGLQQEIDEKSLKSKEEELQKKEDEIIWKEKEEKLQEEKEKEELEDKKERLQEDAEEKMRKENEEEMLRKERERKLQEEKEERLKQEQEERMRREKEEEMLRMERERKLQEEKEKEAKLQEKRYEEALKSEKMELENVINNLKEERDDLLRKLKECEKAELERDSLLEKQHNMELEMKKLRDLLAECNKKESEREKISAKEDKLLEEMNSMRQQSAMYQEEANKAKAANKQLQDEINELKKLLENCRKEVPNDTVIPPSVTPIKEKEKASIVKAVPETVIKEEVAATEEPVKVAAPKDVPKKSISSQVVKKKEKPTSSEALKSKEKPLISSEIPKEKKASISVSESRSEIDISELDPDFQNFLCSLNPFDHKRNICEIEKRYAKKMHEFNRKHEAKVKLLMDQFEKERSLQDKMFNDNMSTVKSGYETDIRKLVERHRASIMRLQSLHEDEIQEMNVNYETQMEAIQNQSENVVNDLTNRVAEKFEELAAQHNKDIREVERKYQKLLQEKEMQHARNVAKPMSRLARNAEDAGVYGSEVKGETAETLDGGTADIQTKFNREMKKLKQSNMKRMNVMKHEYEGLLMCERKKYEKQLEIIIRKLRQEKSVADGTCQCRFEDSCGPKDPDAPLEFNDILEKILSEGLASLDFNEVALVHGKTCAATWDIILNPNVKVELLPPVAVDACARTQLADMNKEELLKRILMLENEIVSKQTETQDAISDMELAIKAMRKKLQELRDSLRSEENKNCEQKFRLSKLNLERINWLDIPEKDVAKQGYDCALVDKRKHVKRKRRHLSTEGEKKCLLA